MSLKIGKCLKQKVVEPTYVMKIEYMHGDADGETYGEVRVRKGEERVFEKIAKIFKKALAFGKESPGHREEQKDLVIDRIMEDEELLEWLFPHDLEEGREEGYLEDWVSEYLYEFGWVGDISGDHQFPAALEALTFRYYDEENAEYNLSVR